MLKIGQLKINGDGKWPKSRAAMKKEIRGLAKELGLDLRFVVRKKKALSWCQVSSGKARVCEGIGGKLFPMSDVMFFALHEVSHWIQFHEGIYRKYFGEPYYNAWRDANPEDVRRLGLRAERHADRTAKRLAMELFGVYLMSESFYDPGNEVLSKALIKQHAG
jgi:hypothetical protein